ncbi:DNA helicase RecQ [Thiohalobacter sp. IOR34]|uniref:DNA helicase RecQ n=1 Tax=Thiohalobacter sp. IOR34 TaxID=3057176 RepID=UPI0025B0DA6A|nr:DNA helicase RecQ [Thiohalobacter sp. IOR34]WJW74950.1 DNA helicase RecQ [Thiohalobacter sp. IOR34]
MPAHDPQATPADELSQARRLLNRVFGYDDFRHHQGEIISTLLAGGDALVLMPTGGGKSLCYQLPALLREGVGVVVSPLIALMQDQVDALRQLGLRAAFLNSTLDAETVHATEQALLRGELDLLYVAPERLLGERMLSLLERARIALFAIDEAHCVSQWGHDFRREYQQLSVLHQRFPAVPRIALTATADQRTRQEIIDQLQLQEAAVFVNSFDRPNIRYTISDAPNPRERLWRFLEQEHPRDAGIVYCLSRKKVESVAEWLTARGREALPYHAGLSDGLRRHHQQRFLREEGLIVVATIAFGMGIDKPDVRFVAHLNLPKSLEAYYQETGRAGRDGLPADAWLAYGLQDVITLRQMTQDTDATEDFKRSAHQKLEAMLGLCELTSCRRQALLAYFGETLEAPCGNCDNCLQPPQTWDATEAARKALSCVYRSGQRFGVNYVIELLTGKDDERIRRNGHHRLSTFGIGRELNAVEWRVLFRQLLAQGYLDTDLEGHGTLRLTARARLLLRGEIELHLRRLRRPERGARERRGRTVLALGEAEQALFEALRSRRRALAEAQGVPPYIIFHDSTLAEMAQRRPTSLGEMAGIPGIGETKLNRFGKAFIEVIREHPG